VGHPPTDHQPRILHPQDEGTESIVLNDLKVHANVQAQVSQPLAEGPATMNGHQTDFIAGRSQGERIRPVTTMMVLAMPLMGLISMSAMVIAMA
jgi:hypothetical protein